MHNTLVFATFPLHSSVFYHSTERFVKFGAVLHHDLSCVQFDRLDGGRSLGLPTAFMDLLYIIQSC